MLKTYHRTHVRTSPPPMLWLAIPILSAIAGALCFVAALIVMALQHGR